MHPFDHLVRKNADTFRIAEAALLFARDHCPSFPPAKYLRRLDALAERVDAFRVTTPVARIAALREVIVREEHIHGNNDRYYDPRNSFLNEVLDRGLGIPISISVIWVDIAASLRWPLHPVSFPGRFLVKYEDGPGEILIDPFADGAEVDSHQLGYLATSAGIPHPAIEAALRPAAPRPVLMRMLNNLAEIYTRSGRWSSLRRVLQRQLALDPESEYLQRALRQTEGQLAALN